MILFHTGKNDSFVKKFQSFKVTNVTQIKQNEGEKNRAKSFIQVETKEQKTMRLRKQTNDIRQFATVKITTMCTTVGSIPATAASFTFTYY